MLLQQLLRPPPALVSIFLLKPKTLHIPPLQTTSLFTSSLPLSSRRLPAALFSSEALLELPKQPIEGEDGQSEAERKEIVSATRARVLGTNNVEESNRNVPNLSLKEKKELASYAHSLGKKLKSQQVGKSGVTDTVIMAVGETLEANELVKLKIHNNCPEEMDDVVKQLEEGTGSVVVARIGGTVILYRPSVTKMKQEEKKKQALLLLRKKKATFKPFQSRSAPKRQSQDQPTRQPSRGRRGSSRYSE
ncbi:OLC1v1002268C1 [Oldenlandia corymbosa var. corymbosa]|uniref:OLC1v1002268C1 n=1 Tax=Oldenlandia corymbosa var. corymbosa TaxID=529605 RepID=A0AAV1D7F2_OLDCO|nr:OLC1v1002268C1 [Oldenlandia corymbosa var. corymbosa]